MPDLNAEKRIGVIKQLAYYPERFDLPEEERGFCSDLVIILRKRPEKSFFEIAILCLVGNQGVSGTSAGAATYLALLSALHQKPLSRNLAAMGEFRKGEVFPVAALRAKITAAFRQGVNCLVLPRQHLAPIVESQELDDLF
ncbi:2844_t:CDS:2 [Entrophospora sp. SA101]|nr:18463_t:CDS:2 [Entrophospora sp. SA101]CAJ0894707.1 2844_t:CDS:2 [Entrophospora sp. SA101]CAJ0909856.1 5180_t:CDS:2 [Entrophospora sp. SA101]